MDDKVISVKKMKALIWTC